MLIPHFTLRGLLGMSAVMGVVFLIMRWALEGTAWAIGVSTVFVLLASVGLVHAGMFALVWSFDRIGSRIASANGRSSSDAQERRT
jgi:hypothetical protein